MNPTSSLLRVLPETVLTLTGVFVMLIEPLLPKQRSRAPLGWLAILGTIGSIAATLWQFHAGYGTAFSGTVVNDPFSIFFHLLIASIVLVTLLVSLDYFEGRTTDVGEYFALVLFGAVGMMFMTSAQELLVVFIGLEISSISTYIMAGLRKRIAASTEAALKYFLLGSFATAFFLYGVALTFGATGSTTLPVIAAQLANGSAPQIAFLGLAMMLIGLGFKVSAAPFHVWTPDVYEGAPSPVVGFMSTAPKAAAFAVLLRLCFGAFASLNHHWFVLLWILAALSMTIGNLGALRQRNVKRMLAYSSIAHAGYLLVAFTALSPEGIAAASFYAAAYAAMNVGAFAVISHLAGFSERRTNISDFAGLAQRAPLLSALLAFFLLSLIGIPFTGGFFGKFYVFSAALQSHVVWLTVIGLINSGIAAYYYLRVLGALYMQTNDAADRDLAVRPVSVPLALALVLTVVATLALGVAPGHVLSLARSGSFFPTQTIAPAAALPQLPAASAIR
jgi:NADH-quinone oxidoreductase subunit N